jgi:hypothetical protein
MPGEGLHQLAQLCKEDVLYRVRKTSEHVGRSGLCGSGDMWLWW